MYVHTNHANHLLLPCRSFYGRDYHRFPAGRARGHSGDVYLALNYVNIVDKLPRRQTGRQRQQLECISQGAAAPLSAQARQFLQASPGAPDPAGGCVRIFRPAEGWVGRTVNSAGMHTHTHKHRIVAYPGQVLLVRRSRTAPNCTFPTTLTRVMGVQRLFSLFCVCVARVTMQNGEKATNCYWGHWVNTFSRRLTYKGRCVRA